VNRDAYYHQVSNMKRGKKSGRHYPELEALKKTGERKGRRETSIREIRSGEDSRDI